MSPVFQGRNYKLPGAYSYTDPSALVSVGLGAGGVLVIVGPAEGGAAEEVEAFTDPVSAKTKHRGGDLINAANYAWAAGASVIYLTRAGAVIQATYTFDDIVPDPTLTVTSQDYGAWCNSIQAKIEDATTGGPAKFKLTVQYYNDESGETTTEVGDELTDADEALAYWTANYPDGLVTLIAVKGSARPVNIVYTNLAGGSDGTPLTTTNWSDAIDLYDKEFVNMIHLAGCFDATVQAYLSGHCTTNSNNRRERIGIVGSEDEDAGAVTGGVPTSGLILNSYNLNSDRMVYVGPGTDGQVGAFTAAKVAGMLAGVDVSTPITHSSIEATSVEYKFTEAQKELLMQYGVCAIEEVPQGRRVLRGITTVQDISVTQENPFKEISIRRIADYINYNMRTNLEGLYVGKKGITGIESSIQNTASSILLRLKESDIITDFRSLSVVKDTSNPQIIYVQYEVAPVSPVNWIFITTRLVPIIT